MTRYRELTEEVARRVLRGDLDPGAELPSVRDLARETGSTTATVGRAYRELAEVGVVEVAARRRARVAASGRTAAHRLLEPGPPLRLAGSDDPALAVVLRRLGDAVAPVAAPGSLRGLAAVARGDADAAAVHLLHRSGTYNAPFARSLLRGRRPHLVHLWHREQGLVLPQGNPDGVTGVGDLAPLRVARREQGSGTRVLLDRLLWEVGIRPESVHGPLLPSHVEVALAVACGIADAGLAVRSCAQDLDLDFVPLVRERYDVVLGGAALGAAAPLVAALHEPDVRDGIGALGGYDLTGCGMVEDLDALPA